MIVLFLSDHFGVFITFGIQRNRNNIKCDRIQKDLVKWWIETVVRFPQLQIPGNLSNESGNNCRGGKGDSGWHWCQKECQDAKKGWSGHDLSEGAKKNRKDGHRKREESFKNKF